MSLYYDVTSDIRPSQVCSMLVVALYIYANNTSSEASTFSDVVSQPSATFSTKHASLNNYKNWKIFELYLALGYEKE